jgi:hypothetical protein
MGAYLLFSLWQERIQVMRPMAHFFVLAALLSASHDQSRPELSQDWIFDESRAAATI